MYISKDKIPNLNLYVNLDLYSKDITDCEETLRLILAHPRDQVIEDLHRIIENSIQYQDIYINELHKDELTDANKVANFPFALHAVYLLGELKSENSLEHFFHILSQTDDYIHTFFGMDIVNEAIWEPIYRLANHKLDAFRPFLFRPDISYLRKTIFLDVAKQVYWHQPGRREEVKQWYITLLRDSFNRAENGELSDPDFMGNIIWDILDLQIVEAKSLIGQAYDKKMVSIQFCGTKEAVLKELGTTDPVMQKRPVLDIFQRYKVFSQEIAEPVETYKSNLNQPSGPPLYEPDASWTSSKSTPYRKKPEPGRNDPCPCGSGKKYKKCCLEKSL